MFFDSIGMQSCYLNSITKKVASITAQKRTNSSLESGFSFKNSVVTGSGQVYLGRAWGDYSRVVFSYTYMDKIVHPKGWSDWGDQKRDLLVIPHRSIVGIVCHKIMQFNEELINYVLVCFLCACCRMVYYGEYKCSGPGANLTGRVPWARILTDEEAQPFIGIQFIEGNTWLISP